MTREKCTKIQFLDSFFRSMGPINTTELKKIRLLINHIKPRHNCLSIEKGFSAHHKQLSTIKREGKFVQVSSKITDKITK